MAKKATAQPAPKTESGDRPAQELRLGRIKATIWANDSDKGTWFNVRVARLYKDAEEWKESDSFSRDDLPLVQEVVHQAWQWIYQQQQGGSA